MLNEKVPHSLAYKLVICILLVAGAWLIHFNIVTSEIYENEIAEYKNIIEYDQEYRTKSINTLYKLIDKKTLNKNETSQP